MPEIFPATHAGHETTYCFDVHRDGQAYRINAANTSCVLVTYGSKTDQFHNLKSALNFALGSPD